MGVAFCVIFNKAVPPYGTLGADHMTLAKGYEKLDAVAAANGLQTLGNFVSQDPEELADLLDLDVAELGAPPIAWFAAADALRAVQALIVQLRTHLPAIARAKEMLTELLKVETELTAAVKAKVKVHFSLVM